MRGDVHLCRELGEARIAYWHGIEEGFAGRKPLKDVTLDELPHGSKRVQ